MLQNSLFRYSKTAIDQPEEWRLEAALVSLLTLTCGDKRLVCAPFRVLPNIQVQLSYRSIKVTVADCRNFPTIMKQLKRQLT